MVLLNPTALSPVTICGATAPEADWLKLHQLEFLLTETASWPYKAQRWIYEQQRDLLRTKLGPPAPVVTSPPPAKPKATATLPIPATPSRARTHDRAANQTASRSPSIQWLLSERNIKLALYSGGLLLIPLRVDFRGHQLDPGFPALANWPLPWPSPRRCTLGGFWLHRRPAYRVGGVALLTIASGFLSLNFLVAQSYIFGPRGWAPENMLLLAALTCLLAYSATAIYTRSGLMTLLGASALVAAVTASLQLARTDLPSSLLAYSLTALLLLGVAALAGRHERLAFTTIPLGLVAHLALPLLYLAGVVAWFFAADGALFASYVTVLAAYILTDWEWHRPVWQTWHQQHSFVSFLLNLPRWFAALLGLSTLLLFAEYHDWSGWQTILAFSLLNAAYLLIAGWLASPEQPLASLPLVLAAYSSSLLATMLAVPDTQNLIIALLANVTLLALSAQLFQNYNFMFGAIWLLLAPLYLILEQWVPDLVHRGIYLGLVALLYAAAGYGFGRRKTGHWHALSHGSRRPLAHRHHTDLVQYHRAGY